MRNIHEFAAHYGLDPADPQTVEGHREYAKQLAVFRRAMLERDPSVEPAMEQASQKTSEGGVR